MVKIAKDEKRIKWHRVRADYVSGMSQRKLASKYGIPRSAIERHSRTEHWTELREQAKADIQEKVVQKTADIAGENAVKAQRIKTRLLDRLETLIEVTLTATEVREYEDGNLVAINRLRDLTTAYKDLTGDMPRAEASDEALQRAREILGGIDSAVK